MEHRAPPADRAEVVARLAELGLDAPDDVCEVFGWHNGYAQSAREIPGDSCITRCAYPFTLDEAVREYLRGPGDTSVLEVAAPSRFPVVKWATGAVVVRCDGPRERPAEARQWDTWPHSDAICTSLAEPVSWWAEWLESRKWLWTPNGWTEDVEISEYTELQVASGLI